MSYSRRLNIIIGAVFRADYLNVFVDTSGSMQDFKEEVKITLALVRRIVKLKNFLSGSGLVEPVYGEVNTFDTQLRDHVEWNTMFHGPTRAINMAMDFLRFGGGSTVAPALEYFKARDMARNGYHVALILTDGSFHDDDTLRVIPNNVDIIKFGGQ
jgi:predicted metal-dependent peptidase